MRVVLWVLDNFVFVGYQCYVFGLVRVRCLGLGVCVCLVVSGFVMRCFEYVFCGGCVGCLVCVVFGGVGCFGVLCFYL